MSADSLCKALDVSPASYYRSKEPEKIKTKRISPRALDKAEKEIILDILTDDKYVDSTVSKLYYTLLDDGEYYCSISTMYAILRENKAVKERRDQLKHPKHNKPILLATGPNQVWSWDITKLKGPNKGEYYNLYCMIDIFSRLIVGWTISPYENKTVARDFIEKTCFMQGIKKEQLVIHSDRGAPMKSKTVGELLMDLGVIRSFSRPRVSNDNAFSEALFKTLKYHRTFPKEFGSIQDARNFLKAFFEDYNHNHYHSGIAMLNPVAVHYGTADKVIEKRKKTMAIALGKNPERFVKKKVTVKEMPTSSWINNPLQNTIEAA